VCYALKRGNLFPFKGYRPFVLLQNPLLFLESLVIVNITIEEVTVSMLKECRNPACMKPFHGFFENRFCPKCEKDQTQSLNVIKDYLATHAGASLAQVQQETGIAMDIIVQMYQTGLFTLVNGPRCSRCGSVQVSAARGDASIEMCQLCKDALKKQFKEASVSLQGVSSEKEDQGKSKASRQYGLGNR
jgi:hypothetical protein